MATLIHPKAHPVRLPTLMPILLELGVPAELTAFALAGAELAREQNLRRAAVRLYT